MLRCVVVLLCVQNFFKRITHIFILLCSCGPNQGGGACVHALDARDHGAEGA